MPVLLISPVITRAEIFIYNLKETFLLKPVERYSQTHLNTVFKFSMCVTCTKVSCVLTVLVHLETTFFMLATCISPLLLHRYTQQTVNLSFWVGTMGIPLNHTQIPGHALTCIMSQQFQCCWGSLTYRMHLWDTSIHMKAYTHSYMACGVYGLEL